MTRGLTRGKTRVTGWEVDSGRSQKNNQNDIVLTKKNNQ
jgi:hypothetical protein